MILTASPGAALGELHAATTVSSASVHPLASATEAKLVVLFSLSQAQPAPSLLPQAETTVHLECSIERTTGGGLISGGGQPIWSRRWSASVAPGVSVANITFVAAPTTAPEPWELGPPTLYNVSCAVGATGGAAVVQSSARFGFRNFSAAAGRFELNGRPIFLRGNSVNPPGRSLAEQLSETKQFALQYLRYLKTASRINAVRIGDGPSASNSNWYDAADEIGMLIYAGPYGNPSCHGCSAKPAARPPPAGALQELVASYSSILLRASSHPSHVILILTNEADIATTNGHWGPSPFAHAYAALLRSAVDRLRVLQPNVAYLGDAGFGEGLAGDIFDDHTYYGWYKGDVTDYYRYQSPLSDQPITFTECVGNYVTAGGNLDVGGKNYAWSLKWTGHSDITRGGVGAKHAAFVGKHSIEIVRRFRARNPNLG